MASWASIKYSVDARRTPRNPEKRRLWLGQQADRMELDDADFRPPVELPMERSGAALSHAAPPACPALSEEQEIESRRVGLQEEPDLLHQRLELLEREREGLLAELDARRREVAELHTLLQEALQRAPALPTDAPEPVEPVAPAAARGDRWGWLRAWFTPPAEQLRPDN